jgi:hypothetical protein
MAARLDSARVPVQAQCTKVLAHARKGHHGHGPRRRCTHLRLLPVARAVSAEARPLRACNAGHVQGAWWALGAATGTLRRVLAYSRQTRRRALLLCACRQGCTTRYYCHCCSHCSQSPTQPASSRLMAATEPTQMSHRDGTYLPIMLSNSTLTVHFLTPIAARSANKFSKMASKSGRGYASRTRAVKGARVQGRPRITPTTAAPKKTKIANQQPQRARTQAAAPAKTSCPQQPASCAWVRPQKMNLIPTQRRSSYPITVACGGTRRPGAPAAARWVGCPCSQRRVTCPRPPHAQPSSQHGT